MKLTPEQWKEVLDRPETQAALKHAVYRIDRRERRRVADALNCPWWFAAIGWTLVVTVPVGVMYLIEKVLL